MKVSQTDTENDKKTKKFLFLKDFMHLFLKFLTNFVDWDNQMGQKGENELSSRLFRKAVYSVLRDKVSNLHRKRQKTQTFPIFKDFTHFC